MFRSFSGSPISPFSPYDTEYTDVEFALHNKDYPRIYAALKQSPPLWNDKYAFYLAEVALSCTPKVLDAVLDHCPPMGELRWVDSAYTNELGYGYSLMAAAAFQGRRDQMVVLRKRGLSINDGDGLSVTPLEAALMGIWQRLNPFYSLIPGSSSTGALNYLLGDADLKQDYTFSLTKIWANAGVDSTFDRCLTRTARRLFPELHSSGGRPPLLPCLDADIAYQYGTAGLISRVFQEQPPSLAELRGFYHKRNLDDSIAEEVHVRMLEESLTLYPQLLRNEQVRMLLLTCYLSDYTQCSRLEPWVRALEGKRVTLRYCGVAFQSKDGLLERWQAKLGDRITPVLNRNRGLPYASGGFDLGEFWDSISPFYSEEDSQEDESSRLEQFLQHCQVTGTPPKDRVSRLGQLAVQALSIPKLVEALRPGGLLEPECPAALLTLARDPELERERAAALLANVKHGEERDPYEL